MKKKLFKITATVLAVTLLAGISFDFLDSDGEDFTFSYGSNYNEITAMESEFDAAFEAAERAVLHPSIQVQHRHSAML